MKKNILIILVTITITLLGICLYMTNEEIQYNEKYEINEEETNIEEFEIKQIENIEDKENSTEIFPELEDLTAENSFYSLVMQKDLEQELQSEKELIFNDFSLNIKVKEPFSLVDIFVNNEEVTQAKRFFNDKQNISGVVNYINKEYSEENISEIFKEYKQDDVQLLENYSSYNFGEIKDVSFMNLEGVYNLTASSSSMEDFDMPIEYRYIACFNCEGKILQIIIYTYKNCSYGQLSFEDLLNLSLEF